MLLRRDHQVSVIVWIEIHNDKAALAARQHEVGGVIGLACRGAQKTATLSVRRRARLVDIGHPPRCPEVLHRQSLQSAQMDAASAASPTPFCSEVIPHRPSSRRWTLWPWAHRAQRRGFNRWQTTTKPQDLA